MKIGIIDSFGKFEHTFFSDKEIKHVNLTSEIAMNSNELSHAELVSSFVFRESTINKLYLVNILNENNNSTIDLLVKAIEKLIIENVNIINISLGIENKSSNMIKLKNICDKAFNIGIRIIAAYNNKNTITYPAEFKSVIGIITDEKLLTSNKLYEVDRLKNNIVFSCNMCSVTHLNMNGFIRGNSYLTAIITGVISNLSYNNTKNYSDILNYFEFLNKYYSDSIFMFTNNSLKDLKSIYIYEEIDNNFLNNNNVIKKININDNLLLRKIENELNNFNVLFIEVKDYKNKNVIEQILNILIQSGKRKKIVFRYPILSIYERYKFYDEFNISINCLSI